MKTIWALLKEEEDMGFLLIDAQNAFNKDMHTRMLWTIWHIWPMEAQLSFNCYRHHTALYLCLGHFLMLIVIPIQEGVTQGDPLAMILYRILLLPLICHLQKEFPDIFQQWYADDGAEMAPIPWLLAFFDHLTEIRPLYGYFPEKSKLIFIIHLGRNEKATTQTAPTPLKSPTGFATSGATLKIAPPKLSGCRRKLRSGRRERNKLQNLR